MTQKKIDRKIAVIFATDVVGYSKHMEANESETIHNLRACEAILTGLFEKYDGRLFNTGGDSFLAEFPSAVSAVECAVEFQKAVKNRNSSDETSVMLEFRIGINSGDVVKEKENLLGDGVNTGPPVKGDEDQGRQDHGRDSTDPFEVCLGDTRVVGAA